MTPARTDVRFFFGDECFLLLIISYIGFQHWTYPSLRYMLRRLALFNALYSSDQLNLVTYNVDNN